jgi:hypothetical protein
MPKRAYYYLWWSKDHWHDKLGPNFPYGRSPLPLPASLNAAGCGAHSHYAGNHITDVPRELYSQDQPAVIERHVRQARAAHLNGFIANWRGTGNLNTGHPCDALHAAARPPAWTPRNGAPPHGHPFDVWLSYEAAATILPASYIIHDLRWLHAKLGGRSAWGRRGGQPVVVWTGSHHYPLSTLREVSKAVRGRFFLVGDEGPTVSSDRLRVFDGLTYYWSSQNPYANPQSFSQLRELAHHVHAANKPWFAPFAPGYQNQLEGGICVPRRHGDTLKRLYNGNRKSNPQAMCLISWNEITEGTYIEPLRRYGDGYVKRTARL